MLVDTDEAKTQDFKCFDDFRFGRINWKAGH